MRICGPRTHCFVALVACVVGAFASATQAQEKIALKLNLNQGDVRKLNLTVDMDNTISVNQLNLDMKMLIGMDMTVHVKEVTTDGAHTLDFTYDRIKMTLTGPIIVDFDSDKKDQNAGPLTKAYVALAGQTITTVMTLNGKVQEVKGFEELAKKLGIPTDQLKTQGDQMSQVMAALPPNPVGIGDTWEGTMTSSHPTLPATVTAKYTLADRQSGDAIVKLDGTIASDQGLNGTVSGVVRIDEETGWTKNGTMTMKMQGTIQGGGSVNMNATTTFGETIKN